jgi:pyruvate formate lyase activating enzyme
VDERDTEDIIGMIHDARLLISGVVLSGGEPTFQPEALKEIARGARSAGLLVGVQTNGIFPLVIADLIRERLVDRVALDVKAGWSRYESLVQADVAENVKKSLEICKTAAASGALPECEVVVTLFRGYEHEAASISEEAGDLVLVLQQGVVHGTEPLSVGEIRAVADGLDRPVRIRTRDSGEEWYEGHRCRRSTSERKR